MAFPQPRITLTDRSEVLNQDGRGVVFPWITLSDWTVQMMSSPSLSESIKPGQRLLSPRRRDESVDASWPALWSSGAGLNTRSVVADDAAFRERSKLLTSWRGRSGSTRTCTSSWSSTLLDKTDVNELDRSEVLKDGRGVVSPGSRSLIDDPNDVIAESDVDASWPALWSSGAGLNRRSVVADDAAFRERSKLLTSMERQKWLNSYMHKLLVVDSSG
ncbi:hypothetical protein WMY93_016692 [Mugilogobius chulae]|uniref:Tuberoinfundibular peptide of 39 residues n=1 Tax=Mugilogobius chulae TaxID=88201 RepID=A0AAW0NQX5_9GOBI